MSKPKYKQGKQIRSISEFESSKCLWYKWRGRTTHRAVLISLQYRTLRDAIKHGVIYTAELCEEQRKGEE